MRRQRKYLRAVPFRRGPSGLGICARRVPKEQLQLSFRSRAQDRVSTGLCRDGERRTVRTLETSEEPLVRRNFLRGWSPSKQGGASNEVRRDPVPHRCVARRSFFRLWKSHRGRNWKGRRQAI